MFDPKKLLDQFLGSSREGGKGGISPDLLKGAAAGGIAGLVLGTKGGRKLAGSALKAGAVVALGGLAYKAWQNYQAGKTGAPPPALPADTPPADPLFLPSAKHEQDELSLSLLRAMIAAAKSDGHIDADEQKRIFGKLDELDLDTEAKAFVMDELRKPLDLDAVVKSATTPERAVEIYAASVLAINADDPAEQAYLSMLAARLKLDPALKASVEKEAALA